jgi:hypothetical protein
MIKNVVTMLSMLSIFALASGCREGGIDVSASQGLSPTGQVQTSADLAEIMAAGGLIVDFNSNLSPSLGSYGRPGSCCSSAYSPKYALIGAKFRGETGFFRIDPKKSRYCFVPVFASNGDPTVPESFKPGRKHSGEVFSFVPVIKSKHFGDYAVTLTYGSRTEPDFESYFSYYSHDGVMGGDNDPAKTYGDTPSKGVIVAIEDYDPAEMLKPVLAGASIAITAFTKRLPAGVNESPTSKAKAALSIIEQYRSKFRDKSILALLSQLETKAKPLAAAGSSLSDE